MRAVTLEIARSEDNWTPERAAKVIELFDGLAPEWHTRDSEGRLDPLVDAFERGDVPGGGVCLELASGTGLVTPWLAERFARVIALDLAMEMLRLAPPEPGHRVRGDAARLPLATGSIGCAVLMNAFLFTAEIDRVIADEGALVWISSRGPQTPIYLSPDEVADTLGDGWSGVSSRAGEGTWSVFRRAR